MSSRHRPILIVGAGFAGAVYARELAERGWLVTVIDKRPNIGGNAYDEVVDTGVRVHRFGPHLLHTNNEQIIRWLTRFGEFGRYEHRVTARLPDGRYVPFPINARTIEGVFGVQFENIREIEKFLKQKIGIKSKIKDAATYLSSEIGDILTDLFFRPYTRKMWGLELEDIDASVVRRVRVRLDYEDRYFPNDKFQLLPIHGYTEIFRNILSHPRIEVVLNEAFSETIAKDHAHCFNSMPIDEYYAFRFGELAYRSIRFHHITVASSQVESATATTNYLDSGCFTRSTDWSQLPYHVIAPGDWKTITVEEPCDYRENNMERYYPIKTSDGRFEAIYRRYKNLSEQEGRITFIGRCGMYRYLDMHQVINQSLHDARVWSERNE